MMNNSQSLSLEQQTMTLARLLSQRQWVLLETILSTTSSSDILIDDPSLPHAVTANIVVHFAARFQAPLRIIMQLSRMYPESISSADITNRYPIHVAAKWSATPDVIAFLIKSNPSVVGAPDSTGKTPMHYVGECYLQHFNSVMFSRDDSMLQVVRLLKGAAPQSVNLEDDEGMCAIEYALINDANIKVVKTMQRACRDDWRERSKSAKCLLDKSSDDAAAATVAPKPPQMGRRRHNDLVNDMKKMALKLQGQHRSDRALGNKISSNERVHVHLSRSMGANTQAARTA